MTASTTPPVVCGYDGSDSAARALRWAAARAEALGTTLRVLSADLAVARVIAVDEGARENVHSKLTAEVEGHIPDAAVDFSIEIVPASPAAALVGASSEAVEVVVGSRGLGRREDLVMGSVSASVVEHAECPVIAIPPDTPAYSQPGRVLLATDGSAEVGAATEFAFAEADRRGTSVTALHVVEAPRMSLFRSSEPVTEETVNADRDSVVEALGPTTERWPDVAVDVAVKVGDAPELLIAESRESALLVMGSRGYGGFAGLLLGSVSRRVLQQADCAVAIVRH